MSEHTEEASREQEPMKKQMEEEAKENTEKTTENGLSETEEDEERKSDVEEEDDGNKDEDDESSEEELGLLEKPVEILSRKRDRKSTERYIDKSSEKQKPAEDEMDYSKGKGMKLVDIEYVKYMIDKTKADDLKQMHRLLFNKAGKTTFLKRNIRSFNGYPFEKETIHYERVSAKLERMFMNDLRVICNVLGLDKGGDKVAVKERIIEYLMEPKDNRKAIPKPKKKSKTPSKKRKSKSKKENKVSEDKDESSASDDSGDEEEKRTEKTPKKKKTPKKSDSVKKSTKKKDDKKKSSTPIKISITGKRSSSTKKKTSNSETKRKQMTSDGSDDDDDAPLIKRTKQEPTDVEVKSVVEEILKDADLEQVTMKTVCRQVYDRFPSFDLTPRKDFIKTTVKEIIS